MAARRLRTVFFGSSAFSVPSLSRLLGAHDVVAVVTQPPKPAGRGLRLTPTPVANVATDAGATVLTPARLDALFVAELARLSPELIACASYGKILPTAVLELPTLAALNVHPSLLPLYRGATPIQSALRDGRTSTGVTIFWMTQKMDAGDIALAREVAIDASEDFGALHDRLAQLGGELLEQAALLLSQGALPRTPQRDEDATYCAPLRKEDLRLRFDVPARRVVDQIRSLSPRPGGWMSYDGARLKVLQAEAVDGGPAGAAGSIAGVDDRGPLVTCALGAIRLVRVVPEGKAPMSGAQFARGR
jgi:methionyl-tRNA formyltransferase